MTSTDRSMALGRGVNIVYAGHNLIRKFSIDVNDSTILHCPLYLMPCGISASEGSVLPPSSIGEVRFQQNYWPNSHRLEVRARKFQQHPQRLPAAATSKPPALNTIMNLSCVSIIRPSKEQIPRSSSGSLTYAESCMHSKRPKDPRLNPTPAKTQPRDHDETRDRAEVVSSLTAADLTYTVTLRVIEAGGVQTNPRAHHELVFHQT